MYDHRLIRDGGDAFTTGRGLARHRADLAFIEAELAKPFAGPTVVVTHHAPHARSIHPKYAATVLSAAFASDLTAVNERGRPDLWLHGHAHASSDYRVGETRVVCNPKGNGPNIRGGDIDNRDFREGFVVEV